jgi:phage terminase large subunit
LSEIALHIATAPVYEPILGRARYIGAYGGRGSGKSWFFAEKLVERAIEQPGLMWVCIREVQKSLAQSAKRNIELKIQALGVGSLFEVQKSEIITPGGVDPATGIRMPPGRIIFQGMQNHTAESAKSLESFDGAWIEEGQTLSATSFQMLRPTIRKKDRLLDGTFRESEIWASWNPRKAKDPIDGFFRGNDDETGNWKPFPGSLCIHANWNDNPWFHETAMVDEKNYDFERDKDAYSHVWLGEYEKNSEARVFKNWKVEWFETPPDAMFYFGADWGFSIDPTVLVRCYIQGRKLYVDREVWKIGCNTDQAPAEFDKIDPEWSLLKARDPNWRSIARRSVITADSADPARIEYMKRQGFSHTTVCQGCEFGRGRCRVPSLL